MLTEVARVPLPTAWGVFDVRAFESPAHRLNGKRYHEHWLHNLVASTSLMGFKNPEPAIR